MAPTPKLRRLSMRLSGRKENFSDKENLLHKLVDYNIKRQQKVRYVLRSANLNRNKVSYSYFIY